MLRSTYNYPFKSNYVIMYALGNIWRKMWVILKQNFMEILIETQREKC